MAQKKRRTKHRGNAAGQIVARGDTGRRTGGPDPRVDRRSSAAQRRAERFDKAPTWRGALNRALIATVIFGVVIVAFFGQPVTAAIPLTIFMLAIYVPMGFYTDQFFYRRRQRQKLAKGA
jgi:hypothetical protein